MQDDNVGCAEYICRVSSLFTGVTDLQLSIAQVTLRRISQYLMSFADAFLFCFTLRFHFTKTCISKGTETE